jgi:hypothetical protein
LPGLRRAPRKSKGDSLLALLERLASRKDNPETHVLAYLRVLRWKNAKSLFQAMSDMLETGDQHRRELRRLWRQTSGREPPEKARAVLDVLESEIGKRTQPQLLG